MTPAKTISIALILLLGQNATAQQTEEAKPKVKLGGFIEWQTLYDTYRSLDTRDGDFYYYPLAKTTDRNGKDINQKSQLEMLALHSRLFAKFDGVEAFGAKASGMIEADFFGTSQAYVRMLRMRHAYMQLQWEKSALILGNTWHPIILPETTPATIAFGAAVPFHSLNRSPQIRFTYNLGSIKLLGAALINGYHRSVGPYDAQRYSGKPELVAQIQGGDPASFFWGASAGYKWLTPRLITDSLYKTDKTVGSYLLHLFARLKTEPITIKYEAVYGENLSHLNMIGGYGKTTGTGIVDNDYDYSNLITLSTWIDFEKKIDKYTVGLFDGYSQNMGSSEKYTAIKDYTRNGDLSYIYRISPRITTTSGPITVGIEYLYNAAVYGTKFNGKGKPTETAPATVNHRMILSARYTF